MHRLLRDLHQDHINLGRVLRILESQLDLVRSGGSADLYVLSEIVDYVQSYPDLIHHPREDVIFMVYRERSTESLDLIERLMEEHRALVVRTNDLRVSLDQWQHDSPVPREHICGLIDEYLRMQWDHLNLEEGSIYSLLSNSLTADDWERIEAEIPRGSDPLFTDQMRRRYENIYEQVVGYEQ
jgi:hemerythrin-like domain-containing protein